MQVSPTLQSLAIFARDHFGEGGFPFEQSVPSSFDIVTETYAEQGEHASPAQVEARASVRLLGLLAARDVMLTLAAYPHAIAYVQIVLRFLAAQYPDVETLRQEQWLLTRLFWGHLLEAQYAARTPSPPPPEAATGSQVSARV